MGVSRHGPWCRDTEAARELRLGHDILFGVATWDRQLSVATRFLVSRDRLAFFVLRREIGVATGQDNWCHNTLFGVATWSRLLGVAT